MEGWQGYYSLIQFCPDRSRLEAANIGVLLFCPERRFVKARVAEHNSRIRRFFGTIPDMDWAQVNGAKEAIVERLDAHGASFQGFEDLRGFVRTRANQVILSEPRSMRVTEPEKDLQQLYEDLVGRERVATARPAPKRLRRRLEDAFRQHDVYGYLVPDVEVEVLTHERKLRVPFAFQNGRFNLIYPTSFRLRDIRAADNKACRLAVEGRYLSLTPDADRGKRELLVVGEFDGNRDIRSAVEGILRVNEVPLYDAQDLGTLVQLIRDTAEPFQERGGASM